MNTQVGEQLKAVRTSFGLSQRELAKRAGVTNGMVSLIDQTGESFGGLAAENHSYSNDHGGFLHA
jgi:transcriptional regulator with XRE-family HTH domain